VINLAYLGAAVLATGLVILGIGLIRAHPAKTAPDARLTSHRRNIPLATSFSLLCAGGPILPRKFSILSSRRRRL
jgi:hypothetical protein